MKSLFDKDGYYTSNAAKVDKAATDALIPIFEKFTSEGFSRREIAHLVNLATMTLEMELLILEKSNMD